MSDLSTWLRWTAGELKTGPIEDGVLEAGMIRCADEIERMQSQLVIARTALARICNEGDVLSEQSNPYKNPRAIAKQALSLTDETRT